MKPFLCCFSDATGCVAKHYQGDAAADAGATARGRASARAAAHVPAARGQHEPPGDGPAPAPVLRRAQVARGIQRLELPSRGQQRLALLAQTKKHGSYLKESPIESCF